MIKNYIEVTSPNLTTPQWLVGTPHDITWDFVGREKLYDDVTPVTVKIEYSYTGQLGDFAVIPGASSVAIGTAGSGSWQWNIGPATLLGTTGKIRVTDTGIANATDTSAGDLKVAGNVMPHEIAAHNTVPLKVGDTCNLYWDVLGLVSNVNLYYCIDKDTPTWLPIDNSGTWDANTQPYPWTVPDKIGNKLAVKVEDAGNPSVSNVTQNAFEIIGKIVLNSPDLSEPDWVVGVSSDIKFTTTGTYSVKIEGSTDNFNSVIWPIATVNAASITSGVMYTHPYNVEDHISQTVKVRVSDAEPTRAANVTDKSTDNFTIKGKLTLSEPTSTPWRCGDTNRTIYWNAQGTVGNVKLEYYDGSSWVEIIASTPTGAGGSGAGSYPWPLVGAAKSASCLIKVTDIDDPTATVSDVTNPFAIWPVITVSEPLSGAIVVVKSNNANLIKWNIKGVSKISTVNIKYDLNNGGEGYTRTVQNNVAVTGADQSFSWNNVPVTARSANVKIRVVDVDDTTNIYSGELPHTFNIVGTLTLSQPDGSNWTIQTGYNIVWSDADGVANVSAYYSTQDGGAGTYNFINTVAAGNGSMPWTTPDQVSNQARVRIIDSTESNVDTALVKATSPQFKLFEQFTNIDPSNGDILTAGEPTSITWTGKGTSLATVELYLIDNVAVTTTFIKQASHDIAGSTSWDVPTTVRSTQCKIRIDSTLNASNTATSIGNFVIKNDIQVTTPNPGTPQWLVGTPHDIIWTFAGREFLYDDVTPVTVKIEYSYTGQLGDFAVIPGAASVAIGTLGSGSWQWNIGSATLLGTTGKIRVTDTGIASATDTSEGNLKVVGNVMPHEIAAHNTVPLKVGDTCNLYWDVLGLVSEVNLYYCIDSATPTWLPIDASGTWDANTQPYPWTVPNAIGNTLAVKIEDAGNPSVSNVTQNDFEIIGKITLNAPDIAEPDWIVGVSSDIKFTTTGTFSVKIEGSTDDFTSNIWTITTVNSANITSGVMYTHPYTVEDHISSNVKIRVSDTEPTRAAGTTDKSTEVFTIKGDITLVTSPGSGALWHVRDGAGGAGDGPARTISWTCAGSVTAVTIQFSNNGVSGPWPTIASGVPSVAGSSNSWTSNNWAGGNGVADAKSTTCLIRVIDEAHGRQKDSVEFKVYPVIKVNTPAAGALLRAESSGNTVAWSTPGSSLVSTVDIDLDFQGGAGGYPSHPVVDYSGGSPHNSVILPSNLSEVAVFKVIDNDNPDVFGISEQFKIHGLFTSVDTPIADWEIGQPATISWSYDGDIGTINIYVAYDGDQPSPTYVQKGSAQASAGSWQWPAVEDNATNVAKIYIEDANVNRKADTYGASNTFNIVGKFTIEHPDTGDVVTTGEPFEVTWYPTGDSVTHVDLYYNVDGGGWIAIPTGQNYANTGNPVSFWWTLNDSVSTENARIQIRSHFANKPATVATSNLFPIHGSITYDDASPLSGDTWVVGQQDKVIDWDITGKVDAVDILYAKTGTSFNYVIASNLDSVANPAPFLWDIPTNQDILSANTGKIRVKDSAFGTVYDESLSFSIQGTLTGFNITFPPDAAQFPNVLRVNEAAVVTWSRSGTYLGNVNIRYSVDRGVTWPAGYIVQTLSSGDGGTGYAWGVSDNIRRDNGTNTGVLVRVESVNDPRVYTQSNMLSIMGRIRIDDPDQQGRTYVVGSTSEDIKWTPTGTYPTVRVTYNTAYNFSGEGDVITNTATNTGSGLPATYDWPQVPNFIRPQIFIKVADTANPDLTYDVTDQLYPCKIRGSITGVSKPVLGEEWNVGDLARLVEWTANGSISKVEIAVAKEANDPATATYTVISPVGGVDSGEGTHDWLSSNWLNGYNGGVADIKSDKCYIRVKDLNDASVPPVYSAKFTIKPLITLSNNPTIWVGGTQSGAVDFHGVTERHQLTWSIPGSQVSNVRIDLSYNGGSQYTYNLAASVPYNTTMPYEITDILPATLSQNAKIKVSDSDPLFSSLVLKETPSFKIIGGLKLNQPAAGSQWAVGELWQVTWTPYGDMGGNVDVYYKYDGGEWSISPVASGPAASGAANWTINDHVSENVQVRIKDAIHPDDTWDDSAVFNIKARFDITYPEDGEEIIAEETIGVTWNKYNINSITHARLEYSLSNGTPGSWMGIVDGIDDGFGQDNLVVNSGSCSWTPPANALSNAAVLRIYDPDNMNSVNQGLNTIFIRAEITVTEPNNDSGPTTWDVGTTETIAWTMKGAFPYVLLYYSTTGLPGDWDLIDEVPTIYPLSSEAGDPDPKQGAYQWTIPETTELGSACYVKVGKSDEPNIICDESDPFTMKGHVELTRPKPSQYSQDAVQRVYGGDAPQFCFIDWTTFGDILNVGIKYSKNGVIWTYIDTVDTSVATQYNWGIPGTDTEIIGTGRLIKVYDTNNEDATYAISEGFEVKGEITLDYPNGGETFIVGVNENIQWTPYGNFPGNQVLLSGSINNFATDFKIAIRPAGPHATPQTYTWNVFNTIEGIVPISTQVKIRVQDYNENGTPKVVMNTSSTLTTKGALEINTPTTTWYVNDTNRNITWDYHGPITVVDLFIRNANDTDWVRLTPEEGTACSTKYYAGFTVPDVISNTSKLRIKDHNDPTDTVEAISNNFIVRGRLTFKAGMPAQNQVFVVGPEQPGYTNDIHWDMDGTFTTVEIRYSINDGADFPDNKILEQGWDANQVYKWSPVEDDMSQQVRFKVIDERDPDNVSAVSQRCIIAGSITILDLTTYNNPIKVGDSFTVKWNKTGLLLQNVDIMYSINGGSDNYPYEIKTNVTASTGQWPWIPKTTDPLSANARIKIYDHDAPTAAYDESPSFKLQAKWVWNETNGDGDPGGKTFVVGEDEVFEWTTTGMVPNVRIDYDVHGDQSWENPPLETSRGNTGYYTWTINETLPNIISDTVLVRVSDVNDSTSNLMSGQFRIRGYLEITDPEASDEWEVDSGKTITWIKRGPLGNVNLYYSYDGTPFADNKITPTAVPAAQGPTGYPWTIPNHISRNVKVRVVSVDDPLTLDDSAQFVITGVLTLDNPDGTDQWVPGDSETISWSKNGTIDFVRVQYSYTGLEIDYATIPGGDAVAGNSIPWVVPNYIGINNRIKIFNPNDAAQPTIEDVSDAFRIKPRLILTAPVKDEIVPINLVTDGDPLKYTISWDVDGAMTTVELQIKYGVGGFTTITGAGSLAAETSPGSGFGQFLWRVPTPPSEDVVIRVLCKDAGQTDIMDDVGDTVGDTCIIAGRLEITAPNGGGFYEVDKSVAITWTNRGLTDVDRVKLRYSTNSGQSYDYDITDGAGWQATLLSYPWTVPNAISEAVMVEISDNNPANHTTGDESDAVFEIRGWIEFTRPLGGEDWIVSTQEPIQWQLHGNAGTVKVEFSVNGTYDPDLIAPSIAGDSPTYSGTGEPDLLGQVPWNIPDDAVGKNNVRIRITNLGDTDVVALSNAFTVKGDFQFISGNNDAPLAAVRWPVNATRTIKWTSFGQISRVRTFYTLVGTYPIQPSDWVEITVDPVLGDINDGQQSWVVTNVIDPVNNNTARIRVMDFFNSDTYGDTELFTIHDVITLTRPNGTDDAQDAKILLVGAQEEVKWNTLAESTGGSGCQSVNIKYCINYVAPVPPLYQDLNTWLDAIVGSTDNDGTEMWTIPNNINNTVRVKISDDNDAQVFDVSNNNCAIKPNFIFSAPLITTTWYSEDQVTISWTTNGTVPNVEIWYRYDGGEWTQVADEVAPIETWPYANDDGNFEWKIPVLPRTTQAQLKIVSSTDVTALKQSALFAIKGRLTVDYPTNSGLTFRSGTTETLRWSDQGLIPTVGLQYEYSGWQDIKNETGGNDHANDGSYDWVVPSTFASDTVKIRVYDISDYTVRGDSLQTFRVKPRIIFSNALGDEPTGNNDEYLYNSSQTLLWTTYGSVPKVDIDLSDNGKTSWIPFATNEDNFDALTWTIPDNVSTNCYIRVKDHNDPNEPDGTYGDSGKFTIRAMISVVSPNGGTDVYVGDSVNIRWTQSGETDTINLYYIDNNIPSVRFALNSTIDNPIYGGSTVANPAPVGGIRTYAWTVPDFINTNIKVGVADPADINLSKDESNTIFAIRPRITISEPYRIDASNYSRWDIGSYKDIEWTWTGTVEEVYLKYSLDGLNYYDITPPGEPVDQSVFLPGRNASRNWHISPGIEEGHTTIPVTPSPNFYIRIIDAADANSYGTSGRAKVRADFTLNATPQPEFVVGDSYTIKWGCVGAVANVDLHYSTDSGATFPAGKQIADDIANNGSVGHLWTIPDDISDQVRVRVMSSIDDEAFDISVYTVPTPDFRIKGDVWIKAPLLNEAWQIQQPYDITWGWKGTIPEMLITYSITGPAGQFNPILENYGTPNDGIVGNGAGAGGEASEYIKSWTIPDEATDQAVIRVRDARSAEADIIDESDNFHLVGYFNVNSPISTDRLNVGANHDIKWEWGGTIAEAKITYSSKTYNAGLVNVVQNSNEILGVGNSWALNAVAGDEIGVGISNPLTVAKWYTIESIDYGQNKLLLSANYEETTASGVMYCVRNWRPIVENYGTPNDGIVANGVGSGGPGSEQLINWQVPDSISTDCIMRIADAQDASVFGCSDIFKIQGAFTLIQPAVYLYDNETPTNPADDYYDCRWVAKEEREVSWTNLGTIASVDLYYSKDGFADLVGGGPLGDQPNGIPDNQTPLKNSLGVNAINVANTGSYLWKVHDDRSDTVSIRVYDHNDHDVFVQGPVPLGGVSTMRIDYYTIKWIIADLITNNPIAGLDVNETDEYDPAYLWSASGRASGETHDVPAGKYTTEWSDEANIYGPISEKYIAGWDEDAQVWRKDRTIFRTMETLVVHIWRSYSEFSYDVDNDNLGITSWLERDGGLVPGSQIVDLNIYDGNTKIKRKTILVDETNNKLLYYDDIPVASVDVWIGKRWNADLQIEEERFQNENVTDCAPWLTSQVDIPADFVGFFINSWTPTAYGTYATLESGKVYAATTTTYLSSGLNITTPVSFTVDIPKKMADMQAEVASMVSTVEYYLDKPMTEVSAELQGTLDAQTLIISNKLDAQTEVIQTGIDDMQQTIQTASDEMVDMVQDTLTSFEERTQDAINDLAEGAAQSLAAAKTMEESAARTKAMMEEAAAITDETARKYSGRLILPNSVLVGDKLEIRYRGLEGVQPYMDVIDYRNLILIKSAPLTVSSDPEQKGLFTTDFIVDSRFMAGKAITIIVVADVGYGARNMEVGSVMIEQTTLTTIEGLVSQLPQVKKAAEEARDMIANAGKALENALKSGTDIDLALTYLQETVESLPKIMAQEGPLPEIAQSINDVSDRLSKLAGEEGYDIGTMMEHAISGSPSIKDIRVKTDQVNGVIDLLKKLFENKFGGVDAPVVSTSLYPGSVVFRVSAANPSTVKAQTTQVKLYLPKEVEAKDIIDQGGLELEYDSERGSYYVYKNDVILEPAEILFFDIEVEDIWMVPEEQVEELRRRSRYVVEQLKGTEYAERTAEESEDISKKLNEVVVTQNDDAVTRNQHIGYYRANVDTVEQVKQQLDKMEKLLTFAGGPPVPEMLKESELKLDAPSTTTTWMIIFIILIFIAILTAVFFFTWQRQKKATESFFTQARESAFPKNRPPSEGEDKQA
ncbi:MAG: hypothetical protein V1727_01100 [Candidatus Omnitrophota bacterium]